MYFNMTLFIAFLVVLSCFSLAQGASLSVTRAVGNPSKCYNYTTVAGDDLSKLASKVGIKLAALQKDNSNVKTLKPPAKTVLLLCNIPQTKMDQVNLLDMVYDQVSARGIAYRRLDTGYFNYWIVPMPTTQKQANDFCVYNNGTLASIADAREMGDLVTAIAVTAALTQVDLWIGGKRAINATRDSFKWADKSKWNYTAWANSYPSNDTSFAACTTLRVYAGPQTAEWMDTDCDNLNPGFLCKFKASTDGLTNALLAPPVPTSIKPATAKTGEQYYPVDLALNSSSTKTTKHWVVTSPKDLPSAHKFCQANKANLTSIHGSRQMDQLRQVTAPFGGYFWVGLLNAGKVTPKATADTYVWTDATPVNYARWALGQPNASSGICTLFSTWSGVPGSSYFISVPCSLEMYFICKF